MIPEPTEGMVSQRVMVMNYIDGFKVTDMKKLKRYEIDRLALVRRIAQAYAQQIYVDGFFNGDPHPGNLMVQVGHDGKVCGARTVAWNRHARSSPCRRPPGVSRSTGLRFNKRIISETQASVRHHGFCRRGHGLWRTSAIVPRNGVSIPHTHTQTH